MWTTERLESMSPRGSLRLMRQEDGDLVIVVAQGDPNGNIDMIAQVEFCTPFAGGGGSPRTYAALIQLAAAMAADNLDQEWHGRRPEHLNDEQQSELVEWGRQCIEAEREFQLREARRSHHQV